MHNTIARNISRLLFVATTAGTLALGAASVASASTEPPTDGSAAADVPTPTAGEPSSPEAGAFCEAYIGVEAAANSDDPAAIEPAIGAAMEVATEDVAPLFEALVTAFQETGGEGPDFDAAYGAQIEWLKANCGYAQLDLTAEEYAYGGLPPEVNAGPTIVSLANIGEEVHEAAIIRLNDDVEATVEEIGMMSVDDVFGLGVPVAFAFAFPEAIGYAVTDLGPGRYIALCFLPEHADPEMIAQMTGPDSSAPPGANFGPEHFTLGMIQEFTVA
jgi:hypothetical protein